MLRILLILFALGLGCGSAPAQTWQLPNPDLGVPKPQGPQLPVPGRFGGDQQERIRAQNEAVVDEVERYYAEKARREQLIQEAANEFTRRRQEQAAFNAAFEARNKPRFEAAYGVLRDMLEGRRPASLPLAVFMVESSYADGQLSYPGFTARLAELADICRGLAGPGASAAARFMALHQLMTDTVRTSYAGKTVSVHLPYRYDFEDFRGEQDYTKMFVSKLLRTNSGNCHSMPLLYKLLADQLGVSAYISMAPNHSYIQVRDDRGALYSYETTTGYFVSEAYYMSSGYIKAGALKSGAYLDTLTQRQNLACQVLDLALGYEHYYGTDDFVAKCAALALTHYPQGMQGHIVAYDVALTRYNVAWQKAGRPTPSAARQIPHLQPLWAEVEQRRHRLDTMGFQEMPKDRYDRWLQSLEQEKARQASRQAASRFTSSSAK